MNRPEAHNAFSRDMMALMADRVHQLADDCDARAAILCGDGPSFCTGLDVKELARGELTAEFFIAWNRMMRMLRELPMPLPVSWPSAYPVSRRRRCANANRFWRAQERSTVMATTARSGRPNSAASAPANSYW
jgi:hypothetical protein